MEMFTGLPEATASIREFERDRLNDGVLPDHVMKAVTEAAGEISPALAITKTAEALYANIAFLGKEGKELGARLTALATEWGWHGLTEQDRGAKMVRAFLRELKIAPLIGSHQKKEDDPAPKSAYAPPSEEPTDEAEAEPDNTDAADPVT